MTRLLLPRLASVLLLAGVGLTAAAPAAAAGSWQWPLEGEPVVARGFDPPEQRWTAGHRGVDLRAAEGARVLSAGDGVVVFAGTVAGRPVVSVQHGALRTTYEPVRAAVRAGQTVSAGARIGTLSRAGSHCAPLACLHWGLRRGEEYLDPLRLLGRPPPRLLPLWSPAPADLRDIPASAPASPAPPAGAPAEASAPGRGIGPSGAAVAGIGSVAAGTLWWRRRPGDRAR